MSTRFLHADELERVAALVGYSVSELARKYGICQRQMRRCFIQEMGQSPKEWLNQRRQHAARELLLDGKLVKEVAVALGYSGNSVNNFSRDFKKVFGVPPSQIGRLMDGLDVRDPASNEISVNARFFSMD